MASVNHPKVSSPFACDRLRPAAGPLEIRLDVSLALASKVGFWTAFESPLVYPSSVRREVADEEEG